MDYEDDLMSRSGCNDFEQEEPEEGPLDLEQEKDMRSSGFIARNDPDAMEINIATDAAKTIIVNVCKSCGVPPPNVVAIGNAVELIRGLSSFNAEQMVTRSMTSQGLSISLLRKMRHEFEQAA